MSSASHWKSATDHRTGRTYYYHEITRETQWRKPLDLASDVERRKMEEKERKQKDFFSAMEANILNSMSQGQVPGTPKDPALIRKKSSIKPTGDGRPDLIRTISTMDESVLGNLIRRQPSFRALKKGKNSILITDLKPSRQGSARSDGFESLVSVGDRSSDRHSLDPVSEAGNDSLPELFSYLPDEDPGIDYSSDDNSVDIDSAMDHMSIKSSRGDAGKFNESSISGFGLSWEETQALKKLAAITKEMMDADDEEEIDFGTPFEIPKLKASAGGTPSWKSPMDSKGARDLPREIEFDDESESEDESSKPVTNATPFQKAKVMGGGRGLPVELDFEDSDDESDDDFAPTPLQSKSVQIKEEKKSPKAEELVVRPTVKRRNTCGTLYVGTTMSDPDKDATIKVGRVLSNEWNFYILWSWSNLCYIFQCVCGVIRSHILSSEADDDYNPATCPFKVFNDLESQQGGIQSQFHNNETCEPVPSLDIVNSFYRGIYFKAQMETDCLIMSLIYIERLIKRTNGKLRPRKSNWRSIMFSCMVLSSKVWDDLSMWNADFSQSCPPGVSFPLARVNQLELAVLNALTFQVKVPASEYAKYYFLLRSMLIKSGLGGDKMSALNPLDVEGARRLQQVSSQFERKPDFSSRSKSLDPGAHRPMRDSFGAPTKGGLEHLVKM